MTYELHTHNPTPTTPYADRNPNDFYPTPLALCQAAIHLLPYNPRCGDKPFILDPGAGNGIWGTAAAERWPAATIIGVESRPEASKPPVYDGWIPCDYMKFVARSNYDYIIGNPPYGDAWDQEQRALKKLDSAYVRPERPIDRPIADAEAFIRKSLQLLAPGGWCLFLLRLAFLEGQERGKGLWKMHRPHKVYVLSNRPSFMPEGHAKQGKTDSTAYALFLWSKATYTKRTDLEWLDWSADS